MSGKHLRLILLIICAAMAVNVHAGKLTVAILGDSNTWLGGDDCQRDKGWNSWFRIAFGPTECKSYARSGATWTHTPATVTDTKEYTEVISDNNVISNQMERLFQETAEGLFPVPEIVIISAGTNDCWFRDKRPDAFLETDEPTTLRGAVKSVVKNIHAHYPHAKIVLLTPMLSTKIRDAEIVAGGDVIEEAGKECGAYVIRQDYPDFIDPEIEKKHFRFTTDGVHTSRPGARRNGLAIAAEVTRLTGLGNKE